MVDVEHGGPEALGAALGLLREFLKEIGEPELDADSRARIERAVAEGKIRFFVAREGAEPVGLCSLTVGFSTYKASPIGVMEDFYVMPKWRGRGVARKLVETLMTHARDVGCGSVIAGCTPGDVPMWEHLGSRKIGVMMAQDTGGGGA